MDEPLIRWIYFMAAFTGVWPRRFFSIQRSDHNGTQRFQYYLNGQALHVNDDSVRMTTGWGL